MAIEVRIPTILRSHTRGAKTVEGSGDTLEQLFVDVDSRHPGLRGRLITEDGALHRFVNVYVNDEDVRFTGALETKLNDGDSVTILPAVAGGAIGHAVTIALGHHRVRTPWGGARRRIDSRHQDPVSPRGRRR